MIKNLREHRAPWECTFAKEDKSKCKPGVSPKSDQEYFEILCLCILQAGLNWGMVRKNWTKFKRGFYGFNIEKLAKVKKDELLKRDGAIKNRIKIEAIISNAKRFQIIKKDKSTIFQRGIRPLRKDFLKTLPQQAAGYSGKVLDKGSFSNLLKSLKGLEDEEAIKILTQMFAHMGKYTAEYYLHSVGYL